MTRWHVLIVLTLVVSYAALALGLRLLRDPSAASAPERPRTRLLWALNLTQVVVASAGIAAWSMSPTARCGASNCCDALLFGVVGERLVSGLDPYAPVLLPGGVDLPFLYPPPALPWFGLWGLVSPRTAQVAAAVTTTVAALLVYLRLHGRTAALAVGAGGWTWLSASLGQTGMLVGGAAALLAHPSVTTRGVALGLLLLKPTIGLPVLVAWAVTGRRSEVARGLALVAALAVVSTAVWGPGVWSAWVEAVLRPYPGRDERYMTSWVALAPGMARWWVHGVWMVGLGVVAVGAPRVGSRHAAPLALALAPLVSPHTHPYDLVVWAVPALALGRGRGASVVVALGATCAVCTAMGWRVPILAAGLLLTAAVALATRAQRAPVRVDAVEVAA